MNFLKSLFGGSNQPKDGGYYVYVRPKMCKEVVRVRINLMNDPSPTEDYDGYLVRKTASANRCPFQAEFTLYFNQQKTVINREITNGEFVDEAAYEDYLASQQA